MLLIDNDVVEQVLTMRECIDAQTEAFAALATGEAVYRPRIDTYAPCDEPDGYYRWGSCEGTSHDVLAIRLKSDVITWPHTADGGRVEHKHCIEPGTYCGLVLLFSTRNGAPLAIIKDGYLQKFRVGGAAGIGTALLSRADSESVAIIGSGGMARTYLEAITCVRKIKRVRIYSPNETNRQKFAEDMSRTLGLEILPCSSAQDAVKGADIVATCTDSMQPVVDARWLEPGMHVMGCTPREFAAEAYTRFDVKVIQGRESLGIENKTFFSNDVSGSMGAFISGTAEQRARLPLYSSDRPRYDTWPNYLDILTGKAPGRTGPEQITHYQPIGNWGVQFSSVGAVVYHKAAARGLGRQLPIEWFTQNIRN